MVLVGGPGPNTLIGGEGDDVLDGAGGTDVLIGGPGQDVADYSSHNARVALSLDGLANDGAAGEGENLGADIEDLRGGTGNDSLTADGGDNVLDGGRGSDVMLGGGGIDGVDYSSRTQWVIADLDGEASDDGEYGEADTIGADVEGLFGGGAGDLLIGNGGDGYLDRRPRRGLPRRPRRRRRAGGRLGPRHDRQRRRRARQRRLRVRRGHVVARRGRRRQPVRGRARRSARDPLDQAVRAAGPQHRHVPSAALRRPVTAPLPRRDRTAPKATVM